MSAHAPIDDAILGRLQCATRGHYEILRELGHGGMAAVFLAVDLSLGRQVALKVLHPGLSTYPGMIQRFLLEARTAARLEHPNIVPVYAAQQNEGLLYFAMKYVPGLSLDHVLARTGALTIAAARFVLTRLGEALQYAHDHGITHRDVKPANVMMDERGNPMLTDFGIARIANGPRLTEQGLVIGTPAYMSPEQMRGAELGPGSDQYSLGVLAYQMLTGTPPFAGSALELATAHLSAIPRPLSELRADCPPALGRAVMRMLEKDVVARWSSLDALVEALAGDAQLEATGARRQLATLVNPNDSASVPPARTPISGDTPNLPPETSATPTGSPTDTPPTPTHSRKGLASLAAALVMLAGASAVVVKASQSHDRRACDDRDLGSCVLPSQPPATAPAGDNKPARVVRVGLAFSRDSVRLVVGDTTTLSLTPAAANDTSLAPPILASDRPAVVSVSASGLVRGTSPGGPVLITAIRGADTARVHVWVAPRPITQVRLRHVPARAMVGDTVRPDVRAYDQSNAEVPNARIRLGVSDTTVADIRDGLLVFKATGTVIVTATTAAVVAEAHVRVTAPGVPALDSTRIAADVNALVAAIDAQDTVRLGRLYPPTDADTRRESFLRWVRETRRVDARLVSHGAPTMTARAAAHVEFTIVLRWKSTLHRPQKHVLFVAEYVYTGQWELSAIRPGAALP